MTYTYSIYNLIYHLPFEIPTLPICRLKSQPDVSVRCDNVFLDLPYARALDDTWEAGFCWQATPGRYLLKGGKRAGRFLVEDGCRVTLDRHENADEALIRFHLLHSVTAAILRQRGYLVLHASTVNTPFGALVLGGSSNAGKSTTLASILKNGWTMVSDDVTVLNRDESGRINVIPGPSMIHLWDDAVQNIGMESSISNRHPIRKGKSAIFNFGKPCDMPVPLHKLCILFPYSGENVDVETIQGKDKFDMLMDCVYGPFFPEEHENLFPVFKKVAEQAEFLRIKRPEGRWTLDEVEKAVIHG